MNRTRAIRLVRALLVACVALGGPAACRTTSLSPEEAERLAQWHPIDLIDVDLNLPLLISQQVTESEARLAGTNTSENRLKIGFGNGKIDTRFLERASLIDAAEKQLGNAEFFSGLMIKAFGSKYDGHQEFREIRHKTRKSVGYGAIVLVKSSRKRCFFAVVGYRMKGGAVHAADFGNVDTVVSMMYCDPKVEFADFASALESVELVKDRAAFAESLRKKEHAAPGEFRGGGRET